MGVKQTIPYPDGLYFITVTCVRFLPLFEISNSYQAVYAWFDHLKANGSFINAYVIMPNHFHALIFFRDLNNKSINKMVGNGKRFMAYWIVNRLKLQGEYKLLETLSSFVNNSDRRSKKLHDVFEPSFDWKECISDRFIEQKLAYIHENPCHGKWMLAEELVDYPHSSAKFYATGQQGFYPVTSYAEMEDVGRTGRA